MTTMLNHSAQGELIILTPFRSVATDTAYAVQASDLSPDNAVNPYHYSAFLGIFKAEFAYNRQQPELALMEYRRLLNQVNIPTLYERALNLALEQQDWQTALEITQQWNHAYPDDVPAMFYLAHIALRTHHYQLAARTLDRIISLDANADLDGILKGIYPEAADEQEALRQALIQSHSRNNPSILVMIAGLDAQQGRFQQALKQVNHALTMRPTVPSFIILKANLYLASGQVPAALRWLERSGRYQKSPDVGLFEVEQLLKYHQPARALSKLQQMLKKWPKNEALLFLAATTHFDQQQYARANIYFKKLQHSELYRDQAAYYLAKNAARKGDLSQAILWYQQVDGTLYTVSRKELTALYLQQQQAAEALRFLTQERVSHPQQASFLYQLQIQLLQSLHQSDRALQLLDEAIAQLPDDVELIYTQVLLLNPKTNQERLDNALNKLIELEPNSPTFLNAYAYILAQQNRKLDMARQYAEQAIHYAPEQPSILDTLGYIEYLQHDYKNAVIHLAEAYQRAPSAGIGLRYAKALYEANKPEQYMQLRQLLQQQYPDDNAIRELKPIPVPSPQSLAGPFS